MQAGYRGTAARIWIRELLLSDVKQSQSRIRRVQYLATSQNYVNVPYSLQPQCRLRSIPSLRDCWVFG